jgi:hypothetical protein
MKNAYRIAAAVTLFAVALGQPAANGQQKDATPTLRRTHPLTKTGKTIVAKPAPPKPGPNRNMRSKLALRPELKSKYAPRVQLPTISRGAERHFGPNPATISGSPNRKGDGGAINGTHVTRKP